MTFRMVQMMEMVAGMMMEEVGERPGVGRRGKEEVRLRNGNRRSSSPDAPV